MNNEETTIIQPQTKAQETTTTVPEEKVKDEKKSNLGKKIAAATIAGGVVGGVGTAGAATMLNGQEIEPEVEAQAEEDAVQPQPQSANDVEHTSETTADVKEEVPVSLDNEASYAEADNAAPTVTAVADDSPAHQPQPTSDEAEPEVHVLGVYEGEEGQEMAVITDGETVAAVVDTTGDGEANYIAIDENHNDMIEEGEVHDISDQHISMQPMEEAYLAEQQQEIEQQDPYMYASNDEPDYVNDADISSFA